MTTREAAWIYQQEQPDDILRTWKSKREPNHFWVPIKDTRGPFDKSLDNMTEKEKDELNEKYLSQNNL